MPSAKRIGVLLGLLPWLLPAACGRARSSSSVEVLGAAVIGPAGGEITVATGSQVGLRFAVPAGALPDMVELRIVGVPPVVQDPTQVIAAPPGEAFRIEPELAPLAVAATLHMPYYPTRIGNTAPGNVRVEQVNSLGSRLYDPRVVDIGNGSYGFVEIAVRTTGQFQVVTGPRAASLEQYVPEIGSSVTLEGGVTFAVESASATDPLVRWRIQTVVEDDYLDFHDGRLGGRESVPQHWRELWGEPYNVWQHTSVGGQSASLTTQVFQPSGSSTWQGGQMVVWGYWLYDAPRTIGDQLVYDVLRLRITLAWNRADLGVGQRDYAFWFAPGHGLVALSQDGVERSRTGL